MQVAISGAGVAGAALAYWLHRTGHTPTLVEQAPKFRTGGLRNMAMRTTNFGPLATFFAGSVRDDFEFPDYGV
ncbi:hypothetical protein A4G29_17140 [Mycobacterium kansasii]|nr:hypothetical protein A4G29_17140 [Mycobacterium kansasii]